MPEETIAILESINDKLVLILFCLVAFLVIAIVRAVSGVARNAKQTEEQKLHDYFVDLFRRHKYDTVLERVGTQLETEPRNVRWLWLKGKSLYMLKRYSEAREVFFNIKTMEPDWTDEAQRYIDRIDEQGDA